MMGYMIRLAWLATRKHPILSAVIVVGLSVGIGVSMTAFTYYRNRGWNPLAHKNDQLFNVRLNAWDPDQPFKPPNEPPEQLTYSDTLAILESTIPKRISASYRSLVYVHPPNPQDHPTLEDLRFVTRDFFTMFDIPFHYGGPWSPEAGQDAEPVVVIDRDTNERLFGGKNSVGQWLQLDSRQYRITGVMDHWQPMPKVYDLTNYHWGKPEPIYIPFHTMRALEKPSYGNSSCWTPGGNGFEEFLHGECVFLQVWVELPTSSDRSAFQAFLDQYALDQRQYGRFQRPLNNRLLNVEETMRDQEVLGHQFHTDMIIAISCLLVCVLNVIGLILGKFMARAGETGIRRALGATRTWVFVAHLVEGGILGILGAALGYPLTLLGLHIMRVWTGEPDAMFRFEPTMWLALIAVAVTSAILAACYPAWHLTRLHPVTCLKTQ